MTTIHQKGTHLFTSESVSRGHPDKLSDQVSDAVLDELLAVDDQARCAVETLCTTGLVMVAGEVTVHNDAAVRCLDKVEDTVRRVIREIGYTDPTMKFDSESCGVIRTIHGQSEDISRGVTEGEGLHKEQGAGDQGLMFGFACKETDALMPMPIHLAHRLVERQADVRAQGQIEGLRPDAKSQVTVEYKDGQPNRLQTIVISTQHTPAWNGDANQQKLREAVIKHIIEPVVPKEMYDPNNIIIHVNPTGQFEIGGPHGDTGLTGRKIIVDTYGGRGRHGGGAFSGKDPTKVDRSAAYMARKIAKNVVAADIADICEVQLAYAIGVAEPVSVLVDTQGTNKIDEDKISEIVRENFPLTPNGIIEHLQLKKPIFQASARDGAFGREGFPWEETDFAAKLKKDAGV